MAIVNHKNEPEEERSNDAQNTLVNDEEYLDMEYSQLNDALDEISSCLDDLERRNEALHKELSDLLESNKQIRQEFQNAAA